MDKTWKITAVYIPNVTEIHYAKAETLYDAFQKFYILYGMKSLTEILITEVKTT